MPFAGRYLSHTLFGWTGVIYLLLGLLALHVVWALGDGADSWDRVIGSFRNPIYIAFHALSLVSVIFVGVRFFRLFPASQPPRIGPAKPPPAPVILAGLYVAWIAVAGGLAVVLAGGIF
jgi:fumarate reductase subunit C